MTTLVFEFRVRADHPALAGHFPGRPIVPGVLLLDRLMEGLSAATGREVIRVPSMKFLSALAPGELARTTCVIDGDRASFRLDAQRAGQRVLLAEGLAVLAPGVPS